MVVSYKTSLKQKPLQGFSAAEKEEGDTEKKENEEEL